MTRTNFIGGGNTPAFFVYFTTGITLTQNTTTLVKFDTETFDTDNAYSTSTGKFIVPSGKAGKYFFLQQLVWQIILLMYKLLL